MKFWPFVAVATTAGSGVGTYIFFFKQKCRDTVNNLTRKIAEAAIKETSIK